MRCHSRKEKGYLGDNGEAHRQPKSGQDRQWARLSLIEIDASASRFMQRVG